MEVLSAVTGEGFVPTGAVQRNGVAVAPGEDARLDELARACALCNEAQLHARGDGWTWRGDPTDVALLAFAHKLGWKKETALLDHPPLGAIAFEPENRYAATFHRMGATASVLVKGAPERIAGMCADGSEARRMLEAAEAMAARGLRVLAVAAGELTVGEIALEPFEPSRLRLLGLVGMIDPARPGVREAVRSAARAGVRTIMVTGDHPLTALAIARDLGLAEGPEQVRTGEDLAGIGERGLAELIAGTRVFARVAPEQKLAIVKAARAAGHVVAVTGDGVNDAPALRAADIGVAMGRGGTDVARDAAELVITDDHYATITAGIEEGRIAYDNIRKVIYLVVSTAAAEVLFVGLAVLTGAPLPLTPVQLLWLNLVTNGIQVMSLGFEPGEPGILDRQPRPAGEGSFNRLMIERCVVAALVMGGVGFAVFHQLLDAGWTVDAARNALLLLMVLFLNVHLLNCRSETRSAFAVTLRQSPVLVGRGGRRAGVARGDDAPAARPDGAAHGPPGCGSLGRAARHRLHRAGGNGAAQVLVAPGVALTAASVDGSDLPRPAVDTTAVERAAHGLARVGRVIEIGPRQLAVPGRVDLAAKFRGIGFGEYPHVLVLEAVLLERLDGGFPERGVVGRDEHQRNPRLRPRQVAQQAELLAARLAGRRPHHQHEGLALAGRQHAGERPALQRLQLDVVGRRRERPAASATRTRASRRIVIARSAADRALAQLALQRAAVDAERAGGGGDIAAVIRQHALDVLPLRAARRRAACGCVADGLGRCRRRALRARPGSRPPRPASSGNAWRRA